ncbi:FIST N-terminal domain-containing protein [Aurantimonas sp. VKM B-3413]|uniref:FIST N-terminal domain-containing protein n=1 Tax=Aurantimonas sp. VKM B-3413 TaxID=2779401 RepID=UPI001E38C50D|nr:FIST C-terminal domain-containing protein [Aurantimonas sp. VKM B-3413]
MDGLCAFAETVAAEDDFSLVLVFFDPAFDGGELARGLKRSLAVPTQICCSTAGGIGPFGYLDGGAILILFPAASFEALAAVIPDLSAGGMRGGAEIAEALRGRFDRLIAERAQGAPLALAFIDGLSMHEEMVVAAFDSVLPDVPLVGGSAGDRLDFGVTRVSLDGRVYEHGAVLCLIWSTVPFRIFKSDHYRPTQTRLVVTESDPDRRLVTALNGAPAASEYATVLGLDPLGLNRFSFASYPVVVKIGGEHYCRSIRRMEENGLSFFCAVETGVVLTLAESRDMADSMRDALSRVAGDLGGIDVVVGFDCVLRRVEAEERQLSRQVASVFSDYKVFGFTTYGEQYRSMHLNQTFTGVAFGAAAGDAAGSA